MDKYAVLGNPINHSRSPFIHTMFAETTLQNMEYGRLLCPLDDFKNTVDNFRREGGKGLNVTVPFKEQAYAYADTLTDRASKAGAVNTIKFCDDGTVVGDNTDGAGFIYDIKRLGWNFAGKRILILGAGGAARGIIGPILDESPEEILLVNRTLEKAQLIQKNFSQLKVATYESLTGDDISYDVIINATSLSLSGQLPQMNDSLYKGALVYDLMYGKTDTTVFTEYAKEHGATQVSDGLGMLVGQAALSFNLWRGVSPDPAPVLKALREIL
ncbi:MAG: shikimate dehydrogenase [Ruminobacter sp.]|jgi:shikimate dehydrogenase|uniref:Shikimate dehydrogenase (NADP(+)) n=1 Tax=Ruminobacter amylophilus TaxID=867 RepID=A0A662ZLI6_9GAMM|nr:MULTISPECIES: shikimate dehydrogenase [Ruminobacter]MBQ3775441.1 shikimate dehydrogenase [Ruminobacter sp.]SFP75249.1 shikimate dehydrogenase [Ruminobacter amylophilus]